MVILFMLCYLIHFVYRIDKIYKNTSILPILFKLSTWYASSMEKILDLISDS